MKLKNIAVCAVALSVFAASGAAFADAKYRVAYLARAQSDSFAAWLANSMVKEAKKYPDISLTVFDGQSRNEVMQSNIENAVTNKFNLVIIQPYDPAIQIGPVKRAMAKGMKFVAVNPKFQDDSVPSVDSSPYLLGQVNAKLALTQVPKNAKVVVLLGPPGNPHSLGRRQAWQKEFFDKRPDVKIVNEQTANWNKDEAMQLMEDWIQANPKIDAVISMNDNMAAGAVEALKGSGMTPFPNVYGVDGTGEACLLIKQGKMTSTALQSADELAEKSVAMAHDILTGKQTNLHQVEGTVLYTKQNVDECIALHKKLGDIK
ncbi:sugar ABC transporter substrate-binding protein [Burkholderia ubonensis]|uniref:sugar ABC transporter substrate-binding protein n=1 Tax=Burkholderia ubonensis TaxID=101571 RepID=UPI000758D314|nr:sugar ABC transporter substrate-binding protein [Burkholderia ubonensis]KVS39905.1 sugar ABC transporter substrate-binding protein [Burkholderia ubonensis]KVS48000.1 sugar ABC transporter substrate-binding protein [Burkholderia ubonensis]KVS78734.1 sugar ABC transporter substrate-binding protein [Burkholderia ubonensis]KVS93465.1 sugar ABC transporter substrate-binding protein [Burkholderia ubonensis]KVS94210.1 sugar ABC transporter substrate-binding protein [Burkholderia ubonensis]